MRLFACACCRLIWRLLDDDRRAAVELAERFADGKATLAARAEACRRLFDEELAMPPDAHNFVRHAALYTVACDSSSSDANAGLRFLSALELASSAAWEVVHAFGPQHGRKSDSCYQEQEFMLGRVSQLIREIFGNPFRPVAFHPGWRTSTVVTVAQAVYDECRFQDLPVLADALEEAGCTNQDILNHCRGGGEHCRGCWALDLILDRV
jgi:hypothetical protein